MLYNFQGKPAQKERAVRILYLIAFAVCFTSFQGPLVDNEQAIYQSLDTFSELLTLVDRHTPGGAPSQELVEGAIDGLLEQLDPHSSFYNESRYQILREDQKGVFFGIGIIVGFQNGALTVISPLDGAPAATAGIRAGDVIAMIDDVITDKVDFNDAIRLLRGEEGSPVKVTVRRSGMEEPLVFSLKRAAIPSNNVRAHFMLNEQTGYIALRDFGETATKELVEAASTLEEAGMTQMILDLRGNPGGLLPQAIQISSLFIPGKKMVVSTKGRLKNANQEYFSSKNSPLAQVPLVVLINRGSASASEIVAGAVQDHDRGLIIGTSSWGKGLVQSVFPLAKGKKGLALTTSRYYTPSGRNIQGDYHSIDEYLNPSSAADLYFTPGKELNVFKTQHGRDVRQARGITPDVYIEVPDDPEIVQELEARHAAFFNFAARKQDTYGKITPDWEPDAEVIKAFFTYLNEEGIEAQGAEDHPALLGQKIKRQLLTIQGPEKAWTYGVSLDPQVKAALELFNKAKEILSVYNGEQSIREDYTTELKQFALLKRALREQVISEE